MTVDQLFYLSIITIFCVSNQIFPLGFPIPAGFYDNNKRPIFTQTNVTALRSVQNVLKYACAKHLHPYLEKNTPYKSENS